MNSRYLYRSIILSILMLMPLLSSAQGWRDNIPEVLQPWIAWVSKDNVASDCLYSAAGADETVCLWQQNLSLDISPSKGKFSYDLVQQNTDPKKQWVQLPGDNVFWPTNVQAGDQSLTVIAKNSLPFVRLAAGSYQISGEFARYNPYFITIPAGVADLRLTLNQKSIKFPLFQGQKLVLNAKPTATQKKREKIRDSVQAKVFRKITDGLPVVVETIVRLNISGSQRTIELTGVRLPQFTLGSIDADLPLEITASGKILVSARAGSYEVRTTAYNNQAISKVLLPEKSALIAAEAALKDSAQTDFWPAEEIWSFAVNPALRSVTVSGVTAVDPSLYAIPYAWQKLNSYRVTNGETLEINEQRRGEAKRSTNQLELDRVIKLNFSGDDFSVVDSITGTIVNAGHLQVQPAYEVGRVTINGENQLITQVTAKNSAAGVEVRPGKITLEAEAQVDSGQEFAFPGWNSEFDRAQVRMFLPPGWQFIHASGAEYVRGSWTQKWSLLDVFILMLAVVALFKLFNWQSACLGFFALLLFEQSLFSISGVVLFVLALVALERHVTNERFLQYARGGKVIVLGFLSIAVLGALFFDLKHAVLPQLAPLYFGQQLRDAPAPATKSKQKTFSTRSGERIAEVQSYSSAVSSKLLAREEQVSAADQTAIKSYQTDPNQAVQTGQGRSDWQSRSSYAFGWSTPLLNQQSVSLTLLSPFASLVVSILRAILIILFLIRLLLTEQRFIGRLRKIVRTTQVKNAAVGLMLTIAVALTVNPQKLIAQEIPDQQMLQELKNYVTQEQQLKPDCLPDCASVNQWRAELDQQSFKFSFVIDSLAETYIALPLADNNLAIEALTLNQNKQSLKLKSQGNQLLVALKAGRNDLEVSGQIADRDTLSLNFKYKPASSSVKLDGWEVSGINALKYATSVVTFKRIAKLTPAPTAVTAQPTNAAVPVEAKALNLGKQYLVYRTIELGFDSKILTRFVRLTPALRTAELNYQLLPGESVLSEEARVKDGELIIEFAPNQKEINFESVIDPQEKLVLRAADNKIWNEIWQLNASNLWHFEYTGTPRIYYQSTEAPLWYPRPGESLTLSLEKPVGIKGATKTAQSARLKAELGSNLQTYVLELQITSSKGEVHQIKLPAETKITEVKINQQNQTFKADASAVDLNLKPGAQSVQISWRSEQPLASSYQLPQIDLGMPAANLYYTYKVPEDRWVLMAGGTQYGPAILFWGYLPLVLILAFGLSKISFIPLAFYQWALLLAGLSQVNFGLNLIVIAWFLFFGLRNRMAREFSEHPFFPFLQVLLVFWTLISFEALFTAIQTGLLGTPQMMIAGNGSSGSLLQWYHDLSAGELNTPWFFSVNIWVYRIAMLLWSLWLASAVISWVKWGYLAFVKHGAWSRKKPVVGIKTDKENTELADQ